MCSCSYGYDPLGLGKNTAQVEKYREYELIHARWAMLAAAGIIIPEGLQVRRHNFMNSSIWSTLVLQLRPCGRTDRAISRYSCDVMDNLDMHR